MSVNLRFMLYNNIRKIRKYLDSHSTERLIHAFISSRIDNCNSLYCGLPVAEIEKLQRVQNAAARLLTGSKRTENITPILRNLHWLPVEKRIKFKTALLVYKALNGMSPSYIKELVVPYTRIQQHALHINNTYFRMLVYNGMERNALIHSNYQPLTHKLSMTTPKNKRTLYT